MNLYLSMKEKQFFSFTSFPPVICVCAGAVFSFYGFAFFRTADRPGIFLIASALLLSAVFSFVHVVFRLHIHTHVKSKSALILVFCLIFGFAVGIANRCAAIKEKAVFPGQDSFWVSGIEGKLQDDPRMTASGRGMGTLDLSRSIGKGGLSTTARGKVMVFFPEGSIPRLKEFGRGANIFVTGNFSKDKITGEQNTKMFSAKGTHIVGPAPRIEQLRTLCRQSVIDAFSSQRARQFGGLALALLLGIRDNLDTELARQYQNAGCSYILALSGMHLAIVSALLAFLLKRPLGLKLSAIIGAVFIVLYVYLVGAQPSLTRAAIMYLLGSAAVLGAFKTNAALLLAAAFLIQINFGASAGDSISFLLSYGALAGILTLGGTFAFLFRGKLPQLLASPLSASLGAFTATMALTIGFFGELRIVGIFAGLILAPLTTVFMIGSIAYLFFCAVLPMLNVPISFMLNIIYSALEKIAFFAGRFPAIITPPSIFTIGISIILPLLVVIFAKYVKRNRLTYSSRRV
ncbi:MAG: ComEC/Rec2 family competence protein [Termitinemataceae bacterium]|nr:MAG: ComEC/Rec2 family competence protein [Termitinemataceae bacterium]